MPRDQGEVHHDTPEERGVKQAEEQVEKEQNEEVQHSLSLEEQGLQDQREEEAHLMR